MELKKIDLNEPFFECQGRKFFRQDSISFTRYRILQQLIIEFSFSATFVELFKNIQTAWDYMNELKLGDAAVTLHNIMYGIKNLDEKDDPALRLCALFFNEKDEDIFEYDEAKMREKIACWGKELDVTPFFRYAANLVPSWINAFRIVSQDGLKKEEKKEEFSH